MPTKYTDRLKLPLEGTKDICFQTINGLNVANGYERVVFIMPSQSLVYAKPFIEFKAKQINQNNIVMPDGQKWRKNNPRSSFIEYRSKDYTNIKIMQWKKTEGELKEGMFYISPFDLVSDKFPILISPLSRRKQS